MHRVIAVLTVLTALACPGVAGAAVAGPPDPGQTTTGSFASGGGDYRFLRYVPRSLPAGKRVPLVVMIHGAQTTAEQEVRVTGYNRLAEREGFIVLYPDVDALGRVAPGPINQSWKFYDPTTYFRGYSDAEAIAAMTRDTIARLPVDTERVYAVGVSAGGLMAAVEAAAYSDIFAAAANVVSAGFADGLCFVTGTGIPAAVSAELAFAQMGPRARVVPTMVMTSDADLAFPSACGEKALEQGLRMNNLVLSGRQGTPLALTPASVRRDQVPGGYAYDVSSYRDRGGCLVGEKWLIHGMPHSWPGEPTTDSTGVAAIRSPDGTAATWAFVRRYTKGTTSLPCAEAPVPPVAAAPPSRTCAARSVTVRLPPGARARRVTVDGRRVRLQRRGAAVRVRLPATTKARATVLVRARAKSGRTITRRHTFKRC
ncbi:hypothetical protein DSM112329_01977 [Paraconexibacter sp. AEG42_29]|uniref:Esterase n=1 Tax=Paraconexibacter sp. AEG42_29 TaxID=2997339 RepID=A0AAU7AU48_9ACTN